MARTECSSFSANPTQYYYYFDGKQVGSNGNNGTENNDHITAFAERVQASPSSPGPFRQGATTGTCFADFDQSYEAISPSSQTATSTTYTVRDGETLASVAQTVWGDASLWYVLADANGLDYDSVLVAGQLLTLPNRPTNQHNSADTFRPYDPATALGDTQPAAPNPPKKKKKCGVFGAILRVVVAVVVAAVVVGSMGAATPVAMALGAAAGSIASQGVAIATGMQSKFSFKEVALSALSAGVGAAIGPATGIVGNGFELGLAQGAIGSIVTQGIAVATGVQKKFDWTGIAVAAVVQGVSSGLNAQFNMNGTMSPLSLGAIGQQALTGGAAGVAGAAVKSLLTGTDFGDNLVAALPMVVASTVVNIAQNIAAGAASGSQGITAETPEADINSDLVPNALQGLSFGAVGIVDPSGFLMANVGAQIVGIADNLKASANIIEQQSYLTDLKGFSRSSSGNGDISIYGKKLSGLEKFWYDVSHPGQTLGRIFNGLSPDAKFDISLSQSFSTSMDGRWHDAFLNDAARSLGDRPIENGGLVFNAALDVVATGGLGLVFRAGESLAVRTGTMMLGRRAAAESIPEFRTFFRGDAFARSSFLSSMAGERGLSAATARLDAASTGELSDIYAMHGISSSGSPLIGVTDDIRVAEYFARGPAQNQLGYVTTFKVPIAEADRIAIPNYENPMAFFESNPKIGLPEREFLFHGKIDARYIFEQQQVKP